MVKSHTISESDEILHRCHSSALQLGTYPSTKRLNHTRTISAQQLIHSFFGRWENSQLRGCLFVPFAGRGGQQASHHLWQSQWSLWENSTSSNRANLWPILCCESLEEIPQLRPLKSSVPNCEITSICCCSGVAAEGERPRHKRSR